jgi:DNA invertase Pin-like site-specific DNA recombinase
MLIGYARVSTQDQNLTLQREALKDAGCEKIYEDHMSAAHTQRPGLIQVLDALRGGDMLVVWKLDRLGRSVKSLVDLVGELARRDVHFKSLTDFLR